MTMAHITQEILNEVRRETQKAVDTHFKKAVAGGDKYEVIGKSPDNPLYKVYPMLGLCGFSWVVFKDKGEAVDLTKLGVKLSVHEYEKYPYVIFPSHFFICPEESKRCIMKLELITTNQST